MLGAVFRALVMGLVGSSNWQLLTSLIYVSIDTLFQTISSFKNPSHESAWDGCDLESGNFSQSGIPRNFRIQERKS